MDLDKILCIKTERTFRNDFTMAHNQKLYQIEDPVKASRVMVQDRLDGSMVITYRDQPLRFKEITVRPIRENKEPPVVRVKKAPTPPPPDHP